MENSAVLLTAINDMKLVDYPIPPELGELDCLVKIGAVGICGSDVHFWQHGRIGDYVVEKPMVIGHESAGTIMKCGKGVVGLKPGDRVSLEPGVPCSSCLQCNRGKYNLCPEIKFFATPPVHGSLTKYINHPSRFCFLLPSNVSLEEGAMCEPLSVGVYACSEKVNVEEGSKVVIFGAGPIGTICSLVAFAMGAEKVILCDIQQSRLDLVKELIPNVDIFNTSNLSVDEIVIQIKNILNDEDGYADCTIDCCGVESAVQSSIHLTRSGGVVCLVGMGCCDMNLPILKATSREVELKGVFRYRNTYPKCIELISTGKIDVKRLITHRFQFNQKSIMDAFESCKRGTGPDGESCIKCMINID